VARKRDNVKLLAKFTTEELHAEVARRHNAGGGEVWGYVICDRDEDDEDEDPRFRIVTKEHWEKEGTTFDHSLGDRVILPEGFFEICEAEYEYREGNQEFAEQLLKQAGFVYLGME